MSRVSFDADYAQRPDITVDANNDAFIFWDEVKDNTALKWEIHGEKVRGANGRELVHRQITLNSMSLFASADVDRRTGEVYLTFSVWGDYLLTPLGVPAMYFAKFDNNFNDIISPRAVLDGNGRRLLGNHVDIAVGPDGLVHAARETLIPPNYGSYIRLNPNGQLVGSETIFRGPGTRLQEVTPFKPALAIDSQNNAHIVFTTPTFMVGGAIPGGHAVYMKVRNGQVVVSPVRIYNNPDNLDGGAEDIAIATDEQGKAHIVVRVRTYQGNFFKLLYYVINADVSVTPPVDLGLSTTMPAEKPSIASREGKVFAGWNDYRNGNMELYLKIKSG
ncbi:hypothetical protein HY469_00215 [Candidatus Roizmanbacteria bacterium]|nr:hypothetical protein [Candidatus Roizmanbacteria bacterium]